MIGRPALAVNRLITHGDQARWTASGDRLARRTDPQEFAEPKFPPNRPAPLDLGPVGSERALTDEGFDTIFST